MNGIPNAERKEVDLLILVYSAVSMCPHWAELHVVEQIGGTALVEEDLHNEADKTMSTRGSTITYRHV